MAATADVEAELAEQKAAEKSTDHPDDYVHQDARASRP